MILKLALLTSLTVWSFDIYYNQKKQKELSFGDFDKITCTSQKNNAVTRFTECNKKGHLLKSTFYNNDILVSRVFYNKQGLYQKEVIYADNGINPETEYLYSYYKNNSLKETIGYRSNGTKCSLDSYQTDGTFKNTIFYNNDGLAVCSNPSQECGCKS